jgi:SHS family sialic acid transporter-like MFS transporter
MSTVDSDGASWYRRLRAADAKAFVASWLGYAMDGFDFGLIALVLTEVADRFHLSTATAATLVSAAFVSRWFGGLVLGAIGDRFGRRTAMVLSILLYSVGTFACGLSIGYWTLFAARLVVGLGMAGEYSATTTYVIESWPRRLRNRASGFLLSGYPLGALVASQLYRVVVPHWGWRAMFFIGIVPIVIAVWLRRRLPEARDWAASVATDKPRDRTFVQVLYSGRWGWLNVALTLVVALSLFAIFTARLAGLRPLLIVLAAAGLVAFAAQFARRRAAMMIALMVTVFCAFLYSWPIQALLPTYLKTTLHFDPGHVATVLSLAQLGYAAGSCLAGFMGDWWGTRAAYCVGLGVSLVFVLPVFALVGGQVWLLGVLLFCQQAFSSGISGILPKYLAGHFETDQRAGGLGFTYNVGALGGAAAPVLGAQIAGRTSLGTALGGLAFGLTLVVILLVAFDVPRRVQQLVTGGPRETDHTLTDPTRTGPTRSDEPQGTAA